MCIEDWKSLLPIRIFQFLFSIFHFPFSSFAPASDFLCPGGESVTITPLVVDI